MNSIQKDLPFQRWFSDHKEMWKSNILPFFSAFTAGMLACMFALTNGLTNFDDVSALFDKGATLYVGRWGLDYISWLLPDYSMPWINRLIGLLFICVGTCFIMYIFRIRNPLLRVVLPATISVFPAFTGDMIYTFMIADYGLAFLFAILSVYFAQEDFKHKWLIRALGILLTTLAMSIYQAYVAMVSSLFLVILLYYLLVLREKTSAVIARGIYFIIHLAVSGILYYAVMKILMVVCTTQLDAYAQWMIMPERSIINAVLDAYSTIINVLNGAYGLMPTAFSRVLHLLLFAALFYEVLRFFLHCETNGERALGVLILMLLPLSVFFMVVITSEKGHTLMYYSFIAFYVLLAILLEADTEKREDMPMHQRIVSGCSLIIMFLVIICNSFAANEAYLRVYLNYENTYAYYTTLLTQVYMTPGFDEDTTLCIVGQSEEQRYQFQQFDNQTMIHGTEGVNHNDYSYYSFIRYFIGSDIPLASAEQIAEVSSEDEFKVMPIYPYYGSVAKMGDMMVVKLSDIG